MVFDLLDKQTFLNQWWLACVLVLAGIALRCRHAVERGRRRGDLLAGPTAGGPGQRDHRDRIDRGRPACARTGCQAPHPGPAGAVDVSEFCTELTGLTQTEVDTGLPFADACARLTAEHAAAKRGWASWGDYDRKQFLRQCDAVPVRRTARQREVGVRGRVRIAEAGGDGAGVADRGTSVGGPPSPRRRRFVEHRRADPVAGRAR